MLEIKNQEHFDEALVFAKKVGKLEQLQEKLNYLRLYGGDSREVRTELYADIGSGHNFTFTVFRKDLSTGKLDRFWFNGGLIYFGKGDSGVGAPQFSVRMDSSTEGWEINT